MKKKFSFKSQYIISSLELPAAKIELERVVGNPHKKTVRAKKQVQLRLQEIKSMYENQLYPYILVMCNLK